MNITLYRQALKLSQIRLARLSGVSRFRLWCYESGDGVLTPEEHTRIRDALRAEAERMRDVAGGVIREPSQTTTTLRERGS
jgi:transcriptional regulator with XRE-family HTH domain